MAGLSASAIIVIAICGAALAVTILFAFARYWGSTNMLDTQEQNRSESQNLYMRQVRQRSREYAYTEAMAAAAESARYGASTRSSQVWSTTGGGGGGPSAGTPGGTWGAKQQYGGRGNSPAYVNYSSYDDYDGGAASGGSGQYHEQQSPYGGGGDYYEYEQQYAQHPQRQAQQASSSAAPVNGESARTD